MTNLVGRTFYRLAERLPGRVSMPRDEAYTEATAIWAKPVGRSPRAVVHCHTAEDVRFAIRAARDCDLPLSVRGGGHDWAGRALCEWRRHRPERNEKRARSAPMASREYLRSARRGRSRKHRIRSALPP